MVFARRFCLAALVALAALAAILSACARPAASKPPGPPSAGADRKSLPLVASSGGDAVETDAVIPIAADDPVRGPRLAPVTIVVFSDFQCPFCSRVATTLERVRVTYGDSVRIVFKNEPLSFHQHARLAAEVGNAVFTLKGPEAFWRYHDIAFRRQQMIAPDAIRAWSIAAGADSRDVEDGLASKKWSAKIDRDDALAKRLHVVGTPASFVNGELLSGALPFERFQEAIDAALVNAKALAGRGTPPEKIYTLAVAAKYKEPTGDSGDDDDDSKPDTTVWRVPVGASPTRGPSTALVTIVEFGDFQCPYCKKVQPTLERIHSEYGDRVRFVWKDEPLSFHPSAVPCANLARAARAQKGEAAFWTMHDKLFAAQPDLADRDLEAAAGAAGLDVPKAMAAVQAKSFAKSINADELLADDVGATGTPHFFVNGVRLVGAQPFEKFKALIDAELTKAEARVRGGVAPAALYDSIIKDGRSSPEPERKVVAPSTLPAPFRGAANARVVIEEFSDFQCPFCSRAEPTIDQLLKDYPTQVKVVWRNLPLPMHPDAPLAAEAAREAFVQKGNDGFSKMRVLLFKHQIDADGLKRAALEGYASQIGLDPQRFGRALDAGTHKPVVDGDAKAANAAGISGTPSFIVGPYWLNGAQSIVKFRRLVDRVLSEVGPPGAAKKN